jgi:hypothetical protein
MTIGEMKNKKTDAEMKITKILQDLEEETGFDVYGIDFLKSVTLSRRSAIAWATIDMRM